MVVRVDDSAMGIGVEELCFSVLSLSLEDFKSNYKERRSIQWWIFDDINSKARLPFSLLCDTLNLDLVTMQKRLKSFFGAVEEEEKLISNLRVRPITNRSDDCEPH